MQNLKTVSKLLSFILRHNPGSVGVTLDKNGWASADFLCNALEISYDSLVEIVETNNKKRFEFDITGELIRARQGHSIEVDLELKPIEPPLVLFHGTKAQFLSSIEQYGITRQTRQYVQLSALRTTADEVANRRSGNSIMLLIDSLKMHHAGFEFFKSANDVWMTKYVPPQYLRVLP